MAESEGGKGRSLAAEQQAGSKRKRKGESGLLANVSSIDKHDHTNAEKGSNGPLEKKHKVNSPNKTHPVVAASPSKTKQSTAPVSAVSGKHGDNKRESHSGKNKQVAKKSPSSSGSDADEEEEGDIDEIDVEDDGSVKSAATRDGEEWKPTDTMQLLSQIQSLLPIDDNVKYSTMADRLDWNKVKVGSFSPSTCKEQWLHISTKLRRFRTMTELVLEAVEQVKQPKSSLGKKTVKNPELPKKPLTPYFRFFMAKREYYSAKHPELTATQLTKELSKKYAKLPEERKQKYLNDYNKEMEEYRRTVDSLKTNQSKPFESESKSIGTSVGGGYNGSVGGASGSKGPPKTVTACMIYINEKCEEDLKNKSTLTRKQMYEQYREAWYKLSDEEKLPYIDKTIEAKKQYDIDLARYRDTHPDFNPRPLKTFLTKAEQKIKDKDDGKPEKPPMNGYSLFTVETLPLLTDMANIERLGEVSKRWKKLSEEKKEAYNLKAEERNQEYREKYLKYLQSLPPDVRRKVEEDDNDKTVAKKKIVPPSSAILNGAMNAEKRTKPVAAVFIYIEDQREVYKRKHPELDDNEVQRQLVKEFNCLSEKEKAKYKQLEEKAKEKQAIENAQTAVSNTVVKKPKKIVFPGEPALPPHSGYQLFSKEMLLLLKDVKANERLQEIGKRWSALSDAEKQKLNKRKDVMWAQYRKDVERFKKTLTAAELIQYEDIHKPSKKRKKAAKEEFPADDDSSSSASNSDDDDNKSNDSSSEISEDLSDDKEEEVKFDSSSESSDASLSDSLGSDSEEEGVDPVASMLAKQPSAAVTNSNNGATIASGLPVVKSGKLSAADVYKSEDESSESSITDSSEDESS